VASWTVTHRRPYRGVEVPFVVVMVQADDQDDIFLLGHFDGPQDGSTLEFGMPVAAGYERVQDATGASATLLRWRPA
jgi:uncharacterized OB-fold protein